MTHPILERIGVAARRFLLVTLVLIGVMCGLIAVLFHRLVELARSGLIGPALAQTGVARPILVIAVPAAVAAALSVIIRRYAPGAGGANLARVRRAYSQEPSLLDGRTLIGTLLLTPLSLGSGAPLGPEGPTVVIASGASAYVGRLLQLPRKVVRGMIPIGTAAGISAIFNTPITGVVFALEEVLGTASRGALGGAIVAAVAAAVVERFMLGGKPLLAAPSASWHDVRELVGFALVGLAAGLVSGFSIRAVLRLRDKLRQLLPSATGRAAVAGAGVGALGLLSPDIFGVGYQSDSAWLHGAGSVASTAVAFGTKTIAFIVAVSSGIIGGTFAPSLFMGAALGGTVGHIAQAVLPAGVVDPGAYALVGMGAFFAGLLRCPIASVLIVVELTGDYGLILPLMLAVALATSLSRRVSPQSLVERQMQEEGYEEEEATGDPLAGYRAADVMTPSPVAIRQDMTLLEAARTAAGTHHRYYPVTDAEGRLTGLLDSDEIEKAARESHLDKLVGLVSHDPVVTANADESIRDVVRKLALNGVDRCPVLAGDGSRRLVGFLSPTDFLRIRLRRSTRSPEHEAEFDMLGPQDL